MQLRMEGWMLAIPARKATTFCTVSCGQVGRGEFGLRFGDHDRHHGATGIGRAVEHGEDCVTSRDARHVLGALR